MAVTFVVETPALIALTECLFRHSRGGGSPGIASLRVRYGQLVPFVTQTKATTGGVRLAPLMSAAQGVSLECLSYLFVSYKFSRFSFRGIYYDRNVCTVAF